jgi:hypothetical protein
MANYLNYGKLSICILIREGKPLYPFLSTEGCEIWHSKSLCGEGVQKDKIYV